ncbi:MAG TPA: DUF5668 domain-containing protein [Candidatus Acidoferrum sp.]|nr:DUF5668 domain-containing protein [Candidatus Acidoferrum sp.]
MKCAVHPEVDATGFCRNCGKALCSVCARPVREVLYCENCLALGMGMPAAPTPQPTPPLPADPYSAPAYIPPPVVAVPPPQPGRSSGAIAFILGFILPGLGAVYNGEYNKALIHIVIFASLIFGLANSDNLSDGAIVMLALLLAGFVFYTAFDSMRVAQAKATGQPVSADPLESIGRTLPMGPVILIGIGVLMLLNNFRIFDFLHLSFVRLWPLVLIGAGIMMFRNRASRL